MGYEKQLVGTCIIFSDFHHNIFCYQNHSSKDNDH